MPLVVHYWADLQSGHGLRCYGNITRTRNVSEYVLVLALCLVILCMHFTYCFMFRRCVQCSFLAVLLEFLPHPCVFIVSYKQIND